MHIYFCKYKNHFWNTVSLWAGPWWQIWKKVPKTWIKQIRTRKPYVQQVWNLDAMCIILPPVLIWFWPKQYPLQVYTRRYVTVLQSKGREWQLWLSQRTFSWMPEDDQVCVQKYLGPTCGHKHWGTSFASSISLCTAADPSGNDVTCQLQYFLALIKGSIRQRELYLSYLWGDSDISFSLHFFPFCFSNSWRMLMRY